ncbi:helix-turn-helix domain-containing protein [Legionella geestiana]|nr:S24 family peptidase [Legionella geestiana]QBS11551.1 helix-turn-helix domain-containing protein [Legionella geestiana]
MNIKEKIGQRILAARMAKNLTRKSLAELTEDLTVSRINNYERGDRTPGPQEIKQLSKALDVSPAYLMCLSDEVQANNVAGLGAFIPVLSYSQAYNFSSYINQIKSHKHDQSLNFIPVSSELLSRLGENAFALCITDDSMEPEIRVNDLLFISPNTKPKPGRYVVAKLSQENEVIIRKYKQVSASQDTCNFELIANNDNWATIKSSDINISDILGTAIYLFRDI